MKYIAKKLLTNSKTGKFIQPSDEVTHLTPEQVKVLLASGAIEASKAVKTEAK